MLISCANRRNVHCPTFWSWNKKIQIKMLQKNKNNFFVNSFHLMFYSATTVLDFVVWNVDSKNSINYCWYKTLWTLSTFKVSYCKEILTKSYTKCPYLLSFTIVFEKIILCNMNWWKINFSITVFILRCNENDLIFLWSNLTNLSINLNFNYQI